MAVCGRVRFGDAEVKVTEGFPVALGRAGLILLHQQIIGRLRRADCCANSYLHGNALE